jgi:hypothetical protein
MSESWDIPWENNEPTVWERPKRKYHELYIDKATRDGVYAGLREAGLNPTRRSTGPQNMHPNYVMDAVHGDNGFGNTLYRTYFSNLYEVEWED